MKAKYQLSCYNGNKVMDYLTVYVFVPGTFSKYFLEQGQRAILKIAQQSHLTSKC